MRAGGDTGSSWRAARPGACSGGPGPAVAAADGHREWGEGSTELSSQPAAAKLGSRKEDEEKDKDPQGSLSP